MSKTIIIKFHFVLFASLLTVIVACNNKPKVLKETQTVFKEPKKLASQKTDQSETKISPNETDSKTVIKFKDLTVSIDSFLLFEETGKTKTFEKDTVEIFSDIGESIEGKLIAVTSNLLEVVTIEQRFETSMTIMNEGPHCDLTDWKHYLSGWQKLKTGKKGQFIGVQYAEKDGIKFPDISLDELKEEVKKQCGTEFFNLLKNIKTQTEYPIGVSISRYYLRITGTRNDNGKTFTKLIIFSTPMGC